MSYIYSLVFFSFCCLVVIALCYLYSLYLSVYVCVSLSDVHSHGVAKEYSVIFKCLGEKNNLSRKQTPLLDGNVATISFLPSSH